MDSQVFMKKQSIKMSVLKEMQTEQIGKSVCNGLVQQAATTKLAIMLKQFTHQFANLNAGSASHFK